MSAPPYATRPPSQDLITAQQTSGMGSLGAAPGMGIPGLGAPGLGAPGLGAPGLGAPGLGVSSRLIRLDPGLFSLNMMPVSISPKDREQGLPALRASLPPGPPGRREMVNISTFRGDGWMTAGDEPTLFRVLPGGAEVLVTLYWSANDPGAAPPPLMLVRLNADAAAQGQFDTKSGGLGHEPGALPMPRPSAPAASRSAAEVVAHIEGVGDVDGRFGEWVGMRGSGRAIEGFSLAPRQVISADDFEIRALLGRDWLSPWLPGGSFCGSRGLALPLRGFCLRLHPAAAVRLDLAAFARFVDGTQTGPVATDQLCASASLSPLEAFQILVRPRIG